MDRRRTTQAKCSGESQVDTEWRRKSPGRSKKAANWNEVGTAGIEGGGRRRKRRGEEKLRERCKRKTPSDVTNLVT